MDSLTADLIAHPIFARFSSQFQHLTSVSPAIFSSRNYNRPRETRQRCFSTKQNLLHKSTDIFGDSFTQKFLKGMLELKTEESISKLRLSASGTRFLFPGRRCPQSAIWVL